MSRRRKILIGLASVAVIIVIAVAVLAFLFLRQVSRPGEATAQYVPSRAPAYMSINLRPGVNQLNLAREVASLLDRGDFADRQDDLLDEWEDDTGIHFLDDVRAWLGTDVSFVVLDADPDYVNYIEWVFMAQIGDEDAARDFVEDFVSYLEDELYTEFDDATRRGVELWVAEDEPIALAIAADYILVGDSEDTVRDMAANLESPPAESLADNPDFIEAQRSLPDQRIMFLFAQSEDLLDDFEEIFNPSDDEEEALDQIRRNTPEYLAASASFVERGLRLDLVADTPSNAFVFDDVNPLESPEALPSDAVAFMSIVGIDKGWFEFRDYLEDSDPYDAEDLEEFLADFEDATGVDLESDLIDSLSGEIAVALTPSDVEPGLFSDSELLGSTLELLFLAGAGDLATLEDALEDFTQYLEDDGVNFDRESLGDYRAVTADLGGSEYVIGDYEPGYVVTEDWAVVGSTLDSLEGFHDAATGITNPLSSAEKFTRLADLAPDPLHFLFYMDVPGMFEIIEDGLDEWDRDSYQENIEPFVEPLESFMMAGSVTDEVTRATFVLTLKE